MMLVTKKGRSQLSLFRNTGAILFFHDKWSEPVTLPPARLNAPADFGIALQQARMSRAMTQQELADLVGVPQSTVSQMESGQTTPYLRPLLHLAQATGLHFQATWDDHAKAVDAFSR
jgi:DNA-binding XRE family transcriptional regulator